MDKNSVMEYGWIIIVTIIVAILVVGATPTANQLMKTVEAEIKGNDFVFEVTLNPNGGALVQKRLLVKPYKAYGFLPEPSLEGSTFVGWFTEPTGGTQITSQTIFKGAADSTLYAHWE